MKKLYTIAVDFDGVLHSYTSPWKNARTIPDPPVPGAIEWLAEITQSFDVAIMSTRNHQWLGKFAMRNWLSEHLRFHFLKIALFQHMGPDFRDSILRKSANGVLSSISFPKYKPPALIYLDDRAIRFTGSNWPTSEDIHRALPWNKPS